MYYVKYANCTTNNCTSYSSLIYPCLVLAYSMTKHDCIKNLCMYFTKLTQYFINHSTLPILPSLLHPPLQKHTNVIYSPQTIWHAPPHYSCTPLSSIIQIRNDNPDQGFWCTSYLTRSLVCMKVFAKFKKILSNSEPPEVSDIQEC